MQRSSGCRRSGSPSPPRRSPGRRDPPSRVQHLEVSSISGGRATDARCLRSSPPPLGGVRRRRPGGPWTRGRSRPVPRQFPRDLQLVGLAPEGTFQSGDLTLKFLRPFGFRALGPRVGERNGASLKELVPPLVVERLGDIVLATDVSDRSIG